MVAESNAAPTNYKGVMVSSTFMDLQHHRAALIKAINGQDLKPGVMENDTAKPDLDVLDSSLLMVQKAAAYVGVISHKYGQVPECPDRNPNGLSLTELEFKEARRLERPILLFIMGDNHDVKRGDVETDPEKIKKLAAFRDNAKRMKEDSSLHRVYNVFNSLQEFQVEATQSIANLRHFLDKQDGHPALNASNAALTIAASNQPDPIPIPRPFYAAPHYIGSHEFVGRNAQLAVLNNWAAPTDSHPILLIEAIGGTGKSMLAWEWTTKHATCIRDDWAGRFWYSFYERDAVMRDFCQRALIYITGQPPSDFRHKQTRELGKMLLTYLNQKPWLIVFDGLERVLVAYHRIDAAQLADEDAGKTDEIAHRDPCAAIRPEDDELLRALAGAQPSKLLLTSRLIPRVLLNASSQPITGVLRERLLGLRPPDAEALFRACGITGDAKEIQNYLESHCDCHPLVTGVLAGLVNDYLPDRGNFDAWASDATGGGRLNLADLDLVQKRNHILTAALDALNDKSRQLLSTLALMSEAVDYPTLCALNPHEPPELLKLQKTVQDLEHRGIIQYDAHTKRHDLHPVVRGIAAGGLRQEEKARFGQRVVDYFSQQTHSPYGEARTLRDVRDGLHLVRALLQMGRRSQAFDAYQGDLANALMHNLEAHAETLTLLRPFFPDGWGKLPNDLSLRDGSYLANNAAIGLSCTGESRSAFDAYSSAVLADAHELDWSNLRVTLSNVAALFAKENRLAKQERCVLLALRIAANRNDTEDLFKANLYRFSQLVLTGKWADAEAMWRKLDSMGRNWQRALYRPGDAEYEYAVFRFCNGNMTDDDLENAEHLANAGKNRSIMRDLHRLRGKWQLQQSLYESAAENLHEAVRMSREIGKIDAESETQLAIARIHLGQLTDPHHEANQLASYREPARRALAELWLAIGDREHAEKHAITAYHWAWADGEPFVRRYELNRSRELLEKLGVEIPNLPPHDPAKDEKLSWEDEVETAINKLR